MNKRDNTPGVTLDLLEHEKVSFGTDAAKPKATDEQLNSRYVKGDVRIVTESARYSLAGILRMLEERVDDEPRYKLDPEYQRRHRWTVERKSRLIESFLMNVPVPPVFLYESDLARFEVMDGRQRLTALSEFYADKFALEGLEHWPDLDGRKYSQLPSKIRDGIDRRYISSIILLNETATTEEQAARLKKLVFERLNSGGVKLSGQETRNAVYNGPLNQLCLQLSENDKFRKMWGIPNDPVPRDPGDNDDDGHEYNPTKAGIKMFEKMDDVELTLRFFAYRQIGEFKGGLNKIAEFLDRFLVEGNTQFTSSTIDSLGKMFTSTVEFLWDTLGSEAFCVIGESKRPAKIIFDPMMYCANFDEVVEARSVLTESKDMFRAELLQMYQEHRELFSGRRTNYRDTQDRNDCVLKTFRNAIKKTKGD